MQDDSQSAIRNAQFMEQLKDFSGLKFGTISPTDIDGFLDFGNHIFVLIELKYKHPSLQGGQRLALERLCDACQSEMREAYVIIATHETDIPNQIDVAGAIVHRMRWHGSWHVREAKHETVRELIDKIRDYHRERA